MSREAHVDEAQLARHPCCGLPIVSRFLRQYRRAESRSGKHDAHIGSAAVAPESPWFRLIPRTGVRLAMGSSPIQTPTTPGRASPAIALALFVTLSTAGRTSWLLLPSFILLEPTRGICVGVLMHASVRC